MFGPNDLVKGAQPELERMERLIGRLVQADLAGERLSWIRLTDLLQEAGYIAVDPTGEHVPTIRGEEALAAYEGK